MAAHISSCVCRRQFPAFGRKRHEMKLFLMSDLVVQELASMRVDGKWLSTAQFAESVSLWISHFAPDAEVPASLLDEIECEVLHIATHLSGDESLAGSGSSLAQLFRDYPAVNYTHPLSAKALAATLVSCREKIVRNARSITSGEEMWKEQFIACSKSTPKSLGCHPTLCQLMCPSKTATEVEQK